MCQCQRGGQSTDLSVSHSLFSFSVSGPDTDTMILFNDAWTPVLRTDDWLVSAIQVCFTYSTIN